MRVLVIPDIHLKGWIFDKAADILNEKKRSVLCALWTLQTIGVRRWK